ncbi:DUF6776 family protein [Herbaspirillum autotrophicum]|uniref:DUF6776 family protein n=1 Tax=Herbaspirillum autotrophicum TaxID=180195 RepID=UPI00067E5E32|nr:DUF6776 family protein [Herbaspirillum autotrophicum]
MSISAPKMTIKRHLPWPLRAVFLAVVVGLGGAIAMWAYDLGRNFAGLNPSGMKDQVATLSEQVRKLGAERDQLSSSANAAESQLNIERSAQTQLAGQIKALETENAKLKEDLAFFESLLPTNIGVQGITIQRLKAEIIAPNQLRYRLLVIQGEKGAREFTGNLQLSVTVLQAGKSAIINFPEQNAADLARYKLAFKYYQRVEGILTLPEGATIKAIQARVLDRGQMRTQQSVNL